MAQPHSLVIALSLVALVMCFCLFFLHNTSVLHVVPEVGRLFLAVPRGCLQFVIVVFPDHTHLLFITRHIQPAYRPLQQ